LPPARVVNEAFNRVIYDAIFKPFGTIERE
jgi:hypothetical protein